MTIWVDLGNIKLNEINQTEKDKYFMISLKCGILKKELVLKKRGQSLRIHTLTDSILILTLKKEH